MNKRLISAAAGAACLAIALTGCSEAEKAAQDAADQAQDAGKSMADCATQKGAEQAKKGEANTEELKDCAKGGASGDASASGGADASGSAGAGAGADAGAEGGAEGGAKGLEVDLGDFSDDPSAMAVGDFYTARQGSLADGDTTEVAKLVTPAYLKKVEKFVAKRQGKKNEYAVTITAVEGNAVDACVGPKGDVPRTINLEKGKVAGIAKSDVTC